MARKPVDKSLDAVNSRAIKALNKRIRSLEDKFETYIEILQDIQRAGKYAAKVAGVLLFILSMIAAVKQVFR